MNNGFVDMHVDTSMRNNGNMHGGEDGDCVVVRILVMGMKRGIVK